MLVSSKSVCCVETSSKFISKSTSNEITCLSSVSVDVGNHLMCSFTNVSMLSLAAITLVSNFVDTRMMSLVET